MSHPKQCRSHDWLKKVHCQGVPRHTGPHWAYDSAGHLIRWKNKKDKDPKWKNIACSWSPPEHKSWISPLDMDKYCYLTIWAEAERKKRDEKTNAKAGKTRK